MGIVILAILVGLIGAYVVRTMLIREPVVETKPPNITVPFTAIDLPVGRTIALGDIALMSLTPKEMQDRGVPVMAMLNPDQIIGRILREPLKQGKPFLTDSFYLQGTRYDFTKELRPGQRAISLLVSKDRGGDLPNGSLVDVIFRATEKAGTQGRLPIPEVTVRLLEGIRIIDVYDPPLPAAVNTGVRDLTMRSVVRVPPPPTITFAVTPEQGEVLQTTSGRGEITLVARPQDERLAASTKRKPLSLQDVLGLEPPPPTILFATEIFRRGARSVNVYRDDKLVEQLREEAAANAPAPPPAPPAPMPPTAVPPTPAPPAPGAGAVPPVPNGAVFPMPVPGLPVPGVPVPGVPVVPLPTPVPAPINP
jgi:Flp pilus assembly protein CpaB